MIPDSYTVPDEDYTKRTFDRFIFMLKQVSKFYRDFFIFVISDVENYLEAN